jgi:hypothetical protein
MEYATLLQTCPDVSYRHELIPLTSVPWECYLWYFPEISLVAIATVIVVLWFVGLLMDIARKCHTRLIGKKIATDDSHSSKGAHITLRIP